MSAREECKDIGLYGLTELSSITGKTRQTLYSWYKNEYDLFLSVLIGAVIYKRFKTDSPEQLGKKLKAFNLLFEIKEGENNADNTRNTR